MSGRKQVKKPLQERVRLEKLLRRLLSKSITVKPTGIEREINHALKMAGKILRADRGYLFSLSGKDAKIGGCHEWSEKGITPRLKPMEGFPAGRFPWLAKELDK